MTPDDLKAALEYIREWNTNAKNCHAAQALLRAILLRHPPADVLAVPGARRLGLPQRCCCCCRAYMWCNYIAAVCASGWQNLPGGCGNPPSPPWAPGAPCLAYRCTIVAIKRPTSLLAVAVAAPQARPTRCRRCSCTQGATSRAWTGCCAPPSCWITP